MQALRNATVTGTVTRIDPAPTLSGQLVNYDVEVTLSGSEQRLRPGMTAVANVTSINSTIFWCCPIAS